MKHSKIFLVCILLTNVLYGQTIPPKRDSIALNEVTILANSNVKLVREQGKYVVYVSNTDFQKSINLWEGLKMIPLMRIRENEDLKINNKKAVVEFNGIQFQMGQIDLESYLKTIDSKTIKKIEVNTNPNASYGSDIEAVINIITSQQYDSYRLSTNVNSGVRTNTFYNTNANISYNFKKLSTYSSYSFTNTPRFNEAIIQAGTKQTAFMALDYIEKTSQKNYQIYTNWVYDVDKNNKIDLTATSYNYVSNKNGIGNTTNYDRVLTILGNNQTKQLAQVWKHSFNDSTNLKIGSYQVWKNYFSDNSATTNASKIETQKLESKTPIIISFIDFIKKTTSSEFSTGIRFHTISVENNNSSIVGNQLFDNPYNYKEDVLAIYANRTWEVSKKGVLSVGLRAEHSFINYLFSSFDNAIAISDRYNYANLLYNLSYTNSSENEIFQTISFRKQIQRPNYNYLNPFQKLNSNITYFSGDTKIVPSIAHSLNYEVLKGKHSFYFQVGMVKDFISTFTDRIDNSFTETYKNFERLFLVGLGLEYNASVIEQKWTTKINFDLNYFKIQDTRYSIQPATPSIALGLNNIIKVLKKNQIILNYNISPTYRDGLIKHHFSHQLDFTYSRTFNKNLSLFIYAYDLLRTNIDWEETTTPNYFYSAKFYNDTRSIGLSLRWNISGKTYQKKDLEKIEDASIERL